MSADDPKIVISQGTVDLLLWPGEQVHTFLSGHGILIGANWQRSDLLGLCQMAGDAEIGGEQCQRIGHGIAIHRRAGPSPLFCRHQPLRLAAFLAGDEEWHTLPEPENKCKDVEEP